MSQNASRLLLITLFIALLAGCAVPGFIGAPVAVLSQGVIVTAPPDATPTPTPFRPIAPTQSYMPTETPTPAPSPTPTSAADAFIAPEQLEALPGQINILLLGIDQRPWQKGKRFRTDTIILATLNKELGTLNLTSFPRDLWLNVPGHGQDRINTAYVYGGIDLLFQTFKENFGIKPDHYVLINFYNFKQFVDELGGLDINVSTELSDYRDGYWTTIPAGPVHMDADTVLWYVRSRKSTNDFARNKRQQEAIAAIMEEVLTLKNVAQVPQLYEIYKDMVTTDLGLSDILPMVPLVPKLADPANVNHYFISPKQVRDWITPGGAMVLVPDMDAIRRVIRRSQNIQ
jgi:LCP family protein required for cell wall assembly